MPLYQSTSHSRLYRDFRAIEPNDYRAIISFYEEQEQAIGRLDFEEYFDLLVGYVDALFETGAYRKHLLMVDVVIEASISGNVTDYQGQDIFRTMLFRKAASLYQTQDHRGADYILRELLRIDPEDQNAAGFLRKCLYRRQQTLLRNTRATAVMLFLVAALVTLAEVLLVDTFLPLYSDFTLGLRNGIFIAGLAFLFGGELLAHFNAWRLTRQFLHKNRRRKRS